MHQVYARIRGSSTIILCDPYARVVNETRIPRGGAVADAIREAGLVIVLRRVGLTVMANARRIAGAKPRRRE
jgi:hypothetical protein